MTRRVRRVDEALAGSSTAVDTPEMLPDQSSSTSSGQGLKSTARKSRGKPTKLVDFEDLLNQFD